MADTDTRRKLNIIVMANYPGTTASPQFLKDMEALIAAKEREARIEERNTNRTVNLDTTRGKEYRWGFDDAITQVVAIDERRIAALRGEAPASGEEQNGDPGGFDKRHVVPKLNATKSMPSVSYSHPLTEEEKEKVDKFIDSIKRRKDNA